MNAYIKFISTLSIAPVKHWGNFHPTKYAAIARFLPRYAGLQTFNIWLWQNQFREPAECPEDSNGLACQAWMVAEEFAQLEHAGIDVGMAASQLTPEEFKAYIKGFNQKVAFLNRTFYLRKTNAVARA